MKAQEFVRQLGQSLELPELNLDDANACRLVLDGNNLDLEKLPDADVLYVIGEVCALPADGHEALFRRLLEGNRYGIETADATLSLDTDTAGVVLHKKLVLEHMDYRAFEEAVSEFYARLLHWKNVCAHGVVAQEKPQDVQDTGMMRV